MAITCVNAGDVTGGNGGGNGKKRRLGFIRLTPRQVKDIVRTGTVRLRGTVGRISIPTRNRGKSRHPLR